MKKFEVYNKHHAKIIKTQFYMYIHLIFLQMRIYYLAPVLSPSCVITCIISPQTRLFFPSSSSFGAITLTCSQFRRICFPPSLVKLLFFQSTICRFRTHHTGRLLLFYFFFVLIVLWLLVKID